MAAALAGLVAGDAEAEPSFGLGGGYHVSKIYGYGLGPRLGYGLGYGYGLGFGLGPGLGYKLGYSPYGLIGGHYRRKREAEPKAEADPGLITGHKKVHHESYTVVLPPLGLGYGLGYGLPYGYGHGLPYIGGYLG